MAEKGPLIMSRHRCSRTGILLLLLIVGAPLAGAYTWRHDADEDAFPTEPTPCPCLKILGDARPLNTWKVDVSPGNPAVHVVNHGEYGAIWAKDKPLTQFELCNIDHVNAVNDDVINGYKAISGGEKADRLHVDWTMHGLTAGSASQFDATTSWWWHPTVVITDDRPTVQVKIGSGEWTDVLLQAEDDPDPTTPDVNEFDVRASALFTWQNLPPSTTATPLAGPNNVMGRFVGHATLTHTVGARARAKAVLHIVVSGSGDNVRVTRWKVGVEAILSTDVS